MAKENANEPKWKKAKIDYFDLKVGGTIEGYHRGVKKVGERTNESNGEITDRCMLILQFEDGEKKQINYTKGLEYDFANSEAKEGDYVRISRLEKKPRGGGQAGEINQYDIFVRG